MVDGDNGGWPSIGISYNNGCFTGMTEEMSPDSNTDTKEEKEKEDSDSENIT